MKVQKLLTVVVAICLSLMVGLAQGATVDVETHNWTGWSSSTYNWGQPYLGSGYKTVQNPGEASTSATVSGLTSDTDYVVWVRGWTTPGQARALRSIVTANSGANKLGQFITQEAVPAGDWYWQKAGIIHTPTSTTSIDYSVHQAYPSSDWENLDQIRLSDDLNYQPTELKLANQGGVFIDGYHMGGGWASQTYNPYGSTPYLGAGNISGLSPSAAMYNDLGGFSANTTYYAWVRAGQHDDGLDRSLQTTITGASGVLLNSVHHSGSYAAGELAPLGGSAWYWQQVGSFTTGASDTELDFTIGVGAGHSASAWKAIDSVYLSTDASYNPFYHGELVLPPVPEPATLGLLLAGSAFVLRRKRS
jgi:hypothetical protein